MKVLSDKIRLLGDIRSGAAEYGGGDSHAQALRFYYDEVLQHVIAQFHTRAKPQRDRLAPVYLQVSMLGFSPETAVLACHAICPQRLLVLYSGNASESPDIVRRFVVGDGEHQISPSSFKAQECPPTDPEGIATIIERAAKEAWSEDATAQIVVDITGGKKAMSAAAALAASQLGLPVVYIDGEYDPKLRRPTPGTERLVVISDGTKIVSHPSLEKQLASCEDLDKSGGFSIMGAHSLNAIAREQEVAGEFTLAGMLYYRCIEACLSAQLMRIVPRFCLSQPDYVHFPMSTKDLLTSMNLYAAKLSSEMVRETLPCTVGVMNAVLILLALDDALVAAAGLRKDQGLRTLYEVTRLRNMSVLAHGSHTLSATECTALAQLSSQLLKAYEDTGDSGNSDSHEGGI